MPKSIQMTANEFQSKYGIPKTDFLVGIDPGVSTGIAVWSTRTKQFVYLGTHKAIEVEMKLIEFDKQWKEIGATYMVYVEDVRKLRLPKHLQNPGRTKGAGSVGRDVQRFLDFLEYHKVPHQAAPMSPKEFRTMDGKTFNAKTGYKGITSEHARSAAGLVYGK